MGFIYSLTGIDVDQSFCRRELNNFTGKCARFFVEESSSKTYKAMKIAAQIFFLLSFTIPVVCAFLVGRLAWIKSNHIGFKIFLAASIGIALLIGYSKVSNWMDDCHREISVQKEEKQIVDFLGGQAAYDAYPRFSANEINDIHLPGAGPATAIGHYYTGYLDQFKPHHVKNQRITVGVDAINRPVVVLLIKPKGPSETADTFAQAFFQRHSPAEPGSWVVAGNDGDAFRGIAGFDDRLATLDALLKGTHPTHELTP